MVVVSITMITDPCRDYRYTVTRRHVPDASTYPELERRGHVRRVRLLLIALACFAGAACIGATWYSIGA